jgi:murein DD-endopeptidase MepM/ murein hydrolase activator NlpD
LRNADFLVWGIPIRNPKSAIRNSYFYELRIMVEQRSLFPLGLLLVFLALLLAFLAAEILRVGPPPEIAIQPASPVIGKRTPIKITVAEPVRGLSSVKVEFIQGERTETLTERSYSPRSTFRFWGARTEKDDVTVEVGRDTISGIKPGDAIIRVLAGRADTWLRHPAPAVVQISLPVRLIPPTLQVTSTQTYVSQGGCGVVVYRVGETTVRDGVRSGSWWFPGYALPGGSKAERFALFAVPYDMPQPQVRLIAADAAGNEAERSFIDKFFPKPPKRDTIQLTEAFMSKVVPEILGQTPELRDRGNLLDNYLAINNELRKIDAEALKSIARESRAEFLWTRPFLAMPNGKVMSAFADRRTYVYEGKDVDHQDHLGFDLAVTTHATVPAANAGIVVTARYFGIFGNAVVIDHGFGLMSLYGHLSSIGVQVGQKVGRGDALGQTGETGLAGGDHLHYTTLLQGLPVDPSEWWDGHWIKDRLALKLGPAFKLEE